jgi:hypothetical protein
LGHQTLEQVPCKRWIDTKKSDIPKSEAISQGKFQSYNIDQKVSACLDAVFWDMKFDFNLKSEQTWFWNVWLLHIRIDFNCVWLKLIDNK